MLLFATPRLCRSRVCGPVVDVLEQVKDDAGDEAAFIHMEIWNGNSREGGQRPQVRAYGLPSEPWLFAIDRSGRVVGANRGRVQRRGGRGGAPEGDALAAPGASLAPRGR